LHFSWLVLYHALNKQADWQTFCHCAARTPALSQDTMQPETIIHLGLHFYELDYVNGIGFLEILPSCMRQYLWQRQNDRLRYA
jgi:hypothetical protein